jgi:hypothetical protein
MPRIEPIERGHAPAKARELLDEHATRAGEPGPMVRTLAKAPALLRGYLDLNRAMKRTNVECMIGWLDALRRDDLEALKATLEPEIIWQGLREDWSCHGADAVG